MRLSTTLIPVIAFVIAAAASVLGARVSVAVVEDRSVDAVQDELVLQGHDWAQVLGDGLQVILEGEAATEAMRFRAMSVAGSMVDAARVIDNMSVTDRAAIAAPDFAIEILRNDSGVSLIGLIPATTDRDALNAAIATIANGQSVTDLLQSADYPVPEAWGASLDYALDVLGRLPRSKISVEAGRVTVHAISDSEAQRRRLEAELARSVPSGIRLGLNITAPRPVVTPFTLRFVIDAAGPRFDACAVDTPAALETITAAVTGAGLSGPINCTMALGVPTRSWGTGVAMAISALAQIGGGTVTFSDADVVLVAANGTDQALFDRVIGELSNALPDVFALEAVLPQPPDASTEGPPEFTGTLSPEGTAQLRGRVPDDLMNLTIENYARARFGNDNVTMGTRITEGGLPQGWSVRILATVEALAMLENGSVMAQPDRVTVTGNTGNPDARDEIARLLIDKLGQGAEFDIDVTYVEALDPVAGLPTPEECIRLIGIVTESRKITFEPGSATLSAATIPVVDDIADILRRCADLRIRIAGYTDSQGRDEMNLALSQQRADAVLDALRSRRVPVASFEAAGYGEADPIADNATEDGREANRRIEFSLIAQEDAAASDNSPAAAGENGEAAAEVADAPAEE